MGEPRGDEDEALRGLDAYERMLDTFADQAKDYWGLWGMLGEHMVRNVDSWATHQRSYVQWLRQNQGLRIQQARKSIIRSLRHVAISCHLTSPMCPED